MKGVTPFQAWTSRKPIVKHFRVFGSLAWAHIPVEKCKAMDPQSKPCIFVGYLDDVKGYRLLHPSTHDLFIERSVHFEESSSISSHTTSPSTITLETLHDDDSSFEDLNPPNPIEESSSSTSDGDNDGEDSHSSHSHLLEVDDSPLDSPASMPLWPQQNFESVGDWLGDPSDSRRTRSQFQQAPHLFIASASDP